MKLKKGDVYKQAKGRGWFRISGTSEITGLVKCTHPEYATFFVYKREIEGLIHTGKLIKIPQLYK